MWYRKPFLILAPPNILFIGNKKSFAKINLQRIYIFIIRQYFFNSCLNRNNFWFAKYINYLYTSRRHGIYSSRHARAILMCLTLLNSFNHMKSFTMFIFSWLKFVKKRGTSIYLWGYMPCLLLCVFIAPFCFGTIWNDIFPTKLAELFRLTISISHDDSTTAGGA